MEKHVTFGVPSYTNDDGFRKERKGFFGPNQRSTHFTWDYQEMGVVFGVFLKKQVSRHPQTIDKGLAYN